MVETAEETGFVLVIDRECWSLENPEKHYLLLLSSCLITWPLNVIRLEKVVSIGFEQMLYVVIVDRRCHH